MRPSSPPDLRHALVALLASAPLVAQAPAQPEPFGIQIVDSATGRGVPLVELETVHAVRFVTDSNGWVALAEPALWQQRVWFHVRSHGYEVAADGFGNRGFACEVVPGGRHRFEIRRSNVAERLYRTTGAGIYRDSVLLGEDVALASPLLDGGVLGSDSIVRVRYRDRLWWFWGDTNRAAYPLGNFEVTGATSLLPDRGGLPPSQGIDYSYFTRDDGFVRSLCPIEGPGPVWIFGAMVVEEKVDEASDREHLLAHFARVKTLGKIHEHGIVEWDDAAEQFVRVATFPNDAPLFPTGNPLRVRDPDGEWFVFSTPYPNTRVPATRAAILDPHAYQTLTGTDADGTLHWQSDVAPRKPGDGDPLTARWLTLRDVETGQPIEVHGGTVQWNDHLDRFVAILLEVRGRSMLGEVWFATADTPLGPWGYARRVVTHDRYSFYNVAHHPCFDEDDGRTIYFEGTYTATFSGNQQRTPRYDYNQVMYRLDLDDPRLDLPQPVYRVAAGSSPELLFGQEVRNRALWNRVEAVPLHARRGVRLDPASVAAPDRPALGPDRWPSPSSAPPLWTDAR